jgi:hypothetical protein
MRRVRGKIVPMDDPPRPAVGAWEVGMESRRMGMLLIAGAVVQLLMFLFGLARRSYAAVAVPVTLAVAGVSALAIWVGWTMMTVEADMPEPELEEPAAP